MEIKYEYSYTVTANKKDLDLFALLLIGSSIFRGPYQKHV